MFTLLPSDPPISLSPLKLMASFSLMMIIHKYMCIHKYVNTTH